MGYVYYAPDSRYHSLTTVNLHSLMAKLIPISRFRSAFPISIPQNDNTLTEVIEAASDKIERYMDRRFLVEKHTDVFHPQEDGELDTRFNKWIVYSDQWPVHKVISVSDPRTGDTITNITIEPFSRGKKDPEKYRYFSIAPVDANIPLSVEYVAGYRLSDETNDKVNRRLGTKLIDFPKLPPFLSQAVVSLANIYLSLPSKETNKLEEDLIDSLAPYRKLD